MTLLFLKVSAENKKYATVDTKHQNKHLQAKYMARDDNPKSWDETTIVNQFIERVKLYALLLQNHEIETANSRLNPNDKRTFSEPPYIFIDIPVREIEGDEFAELNPVIIWNSSIDSFEKMHGAHHLVQEQSWMEFLNLPVQIVTTGEMWAVHHNPFVHSPTDRIIDPYIKNDRMFISIDINTDKKVLKEAFLKLLKEREIPRESTRNTGVTATSEKIIKHAFIPTLDFRILKMHQDGAWSEDEEVKFVEKKLMFKFTDPSAQDYAARKAAIRSVKLLDDWLSDSSRITKIMESLG
jgi:hypothetical protein